MTTRSFASLSPFANLSPFAKTDLKPFAVAQSSVQTMMKSVSAVAKTAQTAGIEWNDFAKQSLEHGTATMRQLSKVRDPKAALTIQAEYLKSSYERFSAQAKLIGELYTGLAKDLGQDFAKAMPAGAKLPVAA